MINRGPHHGSGVAVNDDTIVGFKTNVGFLRRVQAAPRGQCLEYIRSEFPVEPSWRTGHVIRECVNLKASGQESGETTIEWDFNLVIFTRPEHKCCACARNIYSRLGIGNPIDNLLLSVQFCGVCERDVHVHPGRINRIGRVFFVV